MGRFVRVTGEGGVDVRSAMMAIGKLRVGELAFGSSSGDAGEVFA